MNSPFEFFKSIEDNKWTGEVEVTSSQGHATLLIKEGKFLWAHRPLDRAVERLSKISWIQIPDENALQLARTWEALVGQLLAANQDQYGRLVEFLKTDRLEIFFRVFFWTNVEFIPRSFDGIALNITALGFYTLRPFGPLLAEAQKRVEDWPVMKQKMGSSKRIFISLVDPTILKEKNEKEIKEAERTSNVFSFDEIELIKLCDGRNSVQDLIRYLPDGEFLIVRRVLDLWRKGAIRPKDDEQSSISLHARSPDFDWKDLWGAGILAIITSLLWGLLAINKPGPVAKEMPPQELLQALSIHKSQYGHYPLTLSELSSSVLPYPQMIQDFDYAVLSPTEFRLTAKSKDSKASKMIK